MAAYAALLSVTHIIDQINLHPRPPIHLDQTQVQSLTENLTFLQKFLESYSQKLGYRKEPDPLEMHIADAAYAAEDVIESRIVDQIHGEEFSSDELYEDLEKVIREMDCIRKEAAGIKETEEGSKISGRVSAPARKNDVVGFDEILIELLDKVTGGRPDRRIIPIVGMGGIGKTTLARNVYENRVVTHRFDVLVWVTVSQEYRMRESLLQLLQKGGGNSGQMDEYELGTELHKTLTGRRYLIVLDDLWDVDVWDRLKLFFPDNNNGSRVMLTTRMSNLASRVADSGGIQMSFLAEESSWGLFCEIVFGGEGCPLQLEGVGRKIVRSCRGLPLSIVVIGGLLAKSEHTREYWEYIGENLDSVVNSEEDECCLRILHMSYSRLPVYLKPCFLYMGVFEEDSSISVSTLIKLWVAEGFVKPVSAKSLDDIAKEYLKELIDRNLVLVHKLGSTGNVKYCNIHDLLRDLCLREARRDGFYNVVRQRNANLAQCVNTQRRVVIPEGSSNEEVLDILQSMPLARSLICGFQRNSPLLDCRMLRILTTCNDHQLQFEDAYFPENLFMFVNSRYLAVKANLDSRFPSSIHLLWNLQILIVGCFSELTAPADIWNVSQLRHVKFKIRGLRLPEPSEGDIVLENIQTLAKVNNFAFSEEVVRRIPNVKKLGISYEGELLEGRLSYRLDNLNRLHKLESFHCSFNSRRFDILQNLTFPHSLKKLSLEALFSFIWEDIMEKIGTLPLLEKLRLCGGGFRENKWETVEGQFRSLKFLEIGWEWEHDPICEPFVYWTTESSHFPRLEHLVLRGLSLLQEIPSDIGEIPTLKSIVLDHCRFSTIISAKRILEEQEELGEVCLQVRVFDDAELRDEELESLASPNFQVVWVY